MTVRGIVAVVVVVITQKRVITYFLSLPARKCHMDFLIIPFSYKWAKTVLTLGDRPRARPRARRGSAVPTLTTAHGVHATTRGGYLESLPTCVARP